MRCQAQEIGACSSRSVDPWEPELSATVTSHRAPRRSAGAIPIALVGTVEQICETLEQRRERWGFSYWVVHEPEMEAFAEVVKRLDGK